MSRPEFPRCVLPSNCISHIRQEQNYYDADPARAEREQADRAEQAMLEEEMERQQYEQFLEAQAHESEAEQEHLRVCDICMKSEADLYRGEARLIVTLMDGLRWCVECLWDKESVG